MISSWQTYLLVVFFYIAIAIPLTLLVIVKSNVKTNHLKNYIDSIPSIYEQNIVPFCYPGTPIDSDLADIISPFVRKQFNLIGTHTHSDIGEGGFEEVQEMERFSIKWFGKLLGEDNVDGYFCGGGTESIQEGLWIAREYLRHSNSNTKQALEDTRDIITVISPTVHYSVIKSLDMYDISKGIRFTKINEH